MSNFTIAGDSIRGASILAGTGVSGKGVGGSNADGCGPGEFLSEQAVTTKASRVNNLRSFIFIR